ncbi:MAG TPA: 3-hydroxyacyl-CoA dehydrogenase NAD-binding domain-containing protein, partial [Candidatus Binatia bacterium]
NEIEKVKKHLVTARLSDMTSASLVTEAVSESGNIKRSVYRTLRETGFSGVLTTNTSSLTRKSLIESGDYPYEKFSTTHFFNPVLYSQMVEVVRGDINRSNYATLMSFLSDLGRKPIETKDISGFVSNSVLMVYALMALRLLEAGATIEAVDGAAKELRSLPPLFSFDSWKPSIVEDVTRVMWEFRGDDFLRSSTLLAALAKSNPLFYAGQKPNEAIYDLIEKRGSGLDPSMLKLALLTSMRVAAVRTVELGESPATVDFISTEGLKFPRAPLAEIDDLGAEAVLDDLARVNEAIWEGKMQAPELLTAMAKKRHSFFKDGKPNPAIEPLIRGSAHARH